MHDPGFRNCAIFVRYVNSSELHLQSVRSQYSGCKRVFFAGPFPQKGGPGPPGPPGYGPVS